MTKPKQAMQGDDIVYDQAKRAEQVLAGVLNDEIGEASELEEVIGRSWRAVPIKNERTAKPILEATTSKRTMSRMLLITQDTSYLDQNSLAINGLYKLAILFDEIHLMVLLPLQAKQKTKRMADNFWMYRAEAQYTWQLPEIALVRANEELNFSDGFRPDFIVATDPFESGSAAQLISKTYDRPFQVHVKDDFFAKGYFSSFFSGITKRRQAKKVINLADSVRAGSKYILNRIQEKCPKAKNLDLLPQYHSYKAIRQTTPAFDVHDRYGAGFSEIIVAFGPFSVDSHLHDTISALAPVLKKNKKIGCLIIGDGKRKDLLEEKVKKLGINKNVLFLPKHIDQIAILKTADVVVVTDTSAQSEDHVLSAAAAGAAMVMYETNFRLDMFTDGKSVSFCKSGDLKSLGEVVESLISNKPVRERYSKAAVEVIESRVEEDALKYFISLRDSLELTLVGVSEEAVKKDNTHKTDEAN